MNSCLVLVVILCMHSALIGGAAQKLLLETAYDMQMIDGSLVFVPYDTLLYSLPYRNVTYPALKSNRKLLRAYDAVLTVTIDSPQVSFYEAYREAMERGEVARTLNPQQVMHLHVEFAEEGNIEMPLSKAVSKSVCLACRCLLSLAPSTALSSSWLMRCIAFGSLGSGCLGETWQDTPATWPSR